MATKSEAKPVAPAGYKVKQTGGELEGEWLTPEEGVKLEGRLVKAFMFQGNDGKEAAAYGFREPGKTGKLILVSEKAGFADAIRKERMGSDCYLSFDKKVELTRGRTMWFTTFASKDNGRGELVSKALQSGTFTGSGTDIPF